MKQTRINWGSKVEKISSNEKIPVSANETYALEFVSQLSSEATSSNNITTIIRENYNGIFKISSDCPNQPRNIEFKKSGKIGHERSFQSSWYDSYPWLHYDEDLHSAFCFTCVKAAETNNLSTQSLSQGDAFLKKGYQNWKNALEKTRGFQKHEMSKAIKRASLVTS